jgi:short subunit dehydrogenase-like uncharacterized protein
VTGGLGAFLGLAAFPPTRGLLKNRLPQPGEGPGEEARETGYFTVRLVGKGTGRDGRPFQVRGYVRGDKDPGYGSTSLMLGEAALCLALNGQDLEGPGGILTPASAMGSTLLKRLREAGMTFRVDA